MSLPPETTQASTCTCGNCSTENPVSLKFCEGCGHHLYEPCSDCGKPVSLSQKFCGKCGCDLEQASRKRLENYEAKLVEAVKQTKLHDYEQALNLLEHFRQLTDYRFRDVAEQANQARGKIETLRDRATEDASRKIANAKIAFEQQNMETVVNLLTAVPEALRSENADNMLQLAQKKFNDGQVLQNELRNAIAEKNWQLVGNLLDQILTHSPGETKYEELAHQVTDKLLRNAKRSGMTGNFESALESLNAIPAFASTKDIEQQRIRTSKAHWCGEQVQQEPFATQNLGRMALEYAKAANQSKDAQETVKRIAALIKSNQANGRSPLPQWAQSSRSWIGGDFSLLGLPQSDELGQHPLLQANPGQFHVAIGLALQGLGRGRVQDVFASKKKTLFGTRRKKTTRCWGLDLGSAAVKAVLLEEQNGKVVITDTFFDVLPSPTCRKTSQAVSPITSLLSSMIKFAKEKETAETSVLASFPTTQTVTQFVSIPALKEKQTQQILDKEISQKVPLERDEIEVIQWIGEADPENLKGRPVTLSIARHNMLNEYKEMLATAGIDIIGLQSAALGLLNFATFEFPELRDAETENNSTDTTGEQAIAMLDCGAASTTLLVASKGTHWFWVMESGSEKVNSLIARSAKVTHEKAEELKRNPVELQDPAKHFAIVETNLLEVRSRMETALAEMQRRNEQIKIASTWCMGGGSLMHQWMRLVTGKETA